MQINVVQWKCIEPIEVSVELGRLIGTCWNPMASGQIPRKSTSVSLRPDVLAAVESYRIGLPVPPSVSRVIESLIVEGLKNAMPQAQLELLPRADTTAIKPNANEAAKLRSAQPDTPKRPRAGQLKKKPPKKTP